MENIPESPPEDSRRQRIAKFISETLSTGGYNLIGYKPEDLPVETRADRVVEAIKTGGYSLFGK